jgi:hypothetical protein
MLDGGDNYELWERSEPKKIPPPRKVETKVTVSQTPNVSGTEYG